MRGDTRISLGSECARIERPLKERTHRRARSYEIQRRQGAINLNTYLPAGHVFPAQGIKLRKQSLSSRRFAFIRSYRTVCKFPETGTLHVRLFMSPHTCTSLLERHGRCALPRTRAARCMQALTQIARSIFPGPDTLTEINIFSTQARR